jgi:hypothetical protein
VRNLYARRAQDYFLVRRLCARSHESFFSCTTVSPSMVRWHRDCTCTTHTVSPLDEGQQQQTTTATTIDSHKDNKKTLIIIIIIIITKASCTAVKKWLLLAVERLPATGFGHLTLLREEVKSIRDCVSTECAQPAHKKIILRTACAQSAHKKKVFGKLLTVS